MSFQLTSLSLLWKFLLWLVLERSHFAKTIKFNSSVWFFSSKAKPHGFLFNCFLFFCTSLLSYMSFIKVQQIIYFSYEELFSIFIDSAFLVSGYPLL